jgi:hypothetical protein
MKIQHKNEWFKLTNKTNGSHLLHNNQWLNLAKIPKVKSSQEKLMDQTQSAKMVQIRKTKNNGSNPDNHKQ